MSSELEIRTSLRKISTLTKGIRKHLSNGDYLAPIFLSCALFELHTFLRASLLFPKRNFRDKSLNSIIDILVFSQNDADIEAELRDSNRIRNDIMHSKQIIFSSKKDAIQVLNKFADICDKLVQRTIDSIHS